MAKLPGLTVPEKISASAAAAAAFKGEGTTGSEDDEDESCNNGDSTVFETLDSELGLGFLMVSFLGIGRL